MAEALTVYVTVRYKCPNFVDQGSIDDYSLQQIVESMFEDELPTDWTDERPELVSCSLDP